MVINDLSELEIVAQEAKEVQGGFQYSPARANAYAFTYASGNDFAGTITITYTDASFYSHRISYSG